MQNISFHELGRLMPGQIAVVPLHPDTDRETASGIAVPVLHERSLRRVVAVSEDSRFKPGDSVIVFVHMMPKETFADGVEIWYDSPRFVPCAVEIISP